MSGYRWRCAICGASASAPTERLAHLELRDHVRGEHPYLPPVFGTFAVDNAEVTAPERVSA